MRREIHSSPPVNSLEARAASLGRILSERVQRVVGAIPGADVPLRRDPSEVEGHFLLVLGRGDHEPNSPAAHIDDVAGPARFDPS